MALSIRLAVADDFSPVSHPSPAAWSPAALSPSCQLSSCHSDSSSAEARRLGLVSKVFLGLARLTVEPSSSESSDIEFSPKWKDCQVGCDGFFSVPAASRRLVLTVELLQGGSDGFARSHEY